jgi:hypothetical protein
MIIARYKKRKSFFLKSGFHCHNHLKKLTWLEKAGATEDGQQETQNKE